MSAARRRKPGVPTCRVSSEHSPRKKVESGQPAPAATIWSCNPTTWARCRCSMLCWSGCGWRRFWPSTCRRTIRGRNCRRFVHCWSCCETCSSREPLYGVAEWTACFPPDLLDLWDDEVARLHDDRLGRCLDRLFASAGPEMILAVVRHVVGEFEVGLDELHNDSTTVSFNGAYEDAGKEGRPRPPTPAITWGHSKDHRPDLKQLLYTLTISEDGGVPVYFTTASGNVVDDRTHRQTWDLLPPWSDGRSSCTWPIASWPAARISTTSPAAAVAS